MSIRDKFPYLSSILVDPTILDGAVKVHALAAYLNRGPSGDPLLNDIRLIHWNLADDEAFRELRRQAPESEIRVIAIYPNGDTRAESVF